MEETSLIDNEGVDIDDLPKNQVCPLCGELLDIAGYSRWCIWDAEGRSMELCIPCGEIQFPEN